MTRIFTLPHLLIASGNRDKFKELEELFTPFNIKLLLAADLDVIEPEETGDSFIANAKLKARYYGMATDMPTLADDSGLAIEILGGAPGVHSARLAGESKDFVAAAAKIELAMQQAQKEKNDNNNKASFICALSLWWPDDTEESFQGEVHGTIRFPAQGNTGFGYDPIFVPDGYDLSFAQMNSQEKNAISHRKRAFDQLIAACFKS